MQFMIAGALALLTGRVRIFHIRGNWWMVRTGNRFDLVRGIWKAMKGRV